MIGIRSHLGGRNDSVSLLPEHTRMLSAKLIVEVAIVHWEYKGLLGREGIAIMGCDYMYACMQRIWRL